MSTPHPASRHRRRSTLPQHDKPSFGICRIQPRQCHRGGKAFDEYFVQTEAKGGRNKSTPYCVDRFFCYDLTCSFQQVPVDHRLYFACDDDYYMTMPPSSTLQVYFTNGYKHRKLAA